MPTNYQPSEDCIIYIKHKEICAKWDEQKQVFIPYSDPGGLATIGWGHLLTHYDIESGIFEHGLSQHGCDLLFLQDLKPVVTSINNLNISLVQGEIDSFTDLGYNAGMGAVKNVLKLLYNGTSAVEAFYHYIHDRHGNELPGLISRRRQDIAWYNNVPIEEVPLPHEIL